MADQVTANPKDEEAVNPPDYQEEEFRIWPHNYGTRPYPYLEEILFESARMMEVRIAMLKYSIANPHWERITRINNLHSLINQITTQVSLIIPPHLAGMLN
ncbi:hypothetical protein ABW19_dt0201101 [Dactylella cylindrospora]|nr:hypothetical protein ABW19_dt0201101 [Dactylella cylindrospora]